MFSLIKLIFSIAATVAIGVAIIYFLPADIKSSVVQKVTGILPESIKAKTKEILMTPPEKRQELLQQLETKLQELKNQAPDKAQDLIKETDTLINNLKSQNQEESLGEIIKKKLVDTFLLKSATNTTATNQPCLK